MTILSVGLLGVAGLQLKGLQSTHSAFQRTMATIIAKDAVERLWVDLADGNAVDVARVKADWLSHWRTAEVTLPTLEGEITRSGSRYSISVRWAEQRLDNTQETRFDYATELPPNK